jgi:hypothetical protein
MHRQHTDREQMGNRSLPVPIHGRYRWEASEEDGHGWALGGDV